MERKRKELEALISCYEEQLRLAKHRQFGTSSEKSPYDLNQVCFLNEAEATADANVAEPKLIEVEKHCRKRTRLTTDRLPEGLPVEVVEHDLPEEEQVCPECGGRLHVMGKETRRELLIVDPLRAYCAYEHLPLECRASFKCDLPKVDKRFDPREEGARHDSMYGDPYGRSLCHAWGSGPVYLLGRYVAGVEVIDVAYKTFDVSPQPGAYRFFVSETPSADRCAWNTTPARARSRQWPPARAARSGLWAGARDARERADHDRMGGLK